MVFKLISKKFTNTLQLVYNHLSSNGSTTLTVKVLRQRKGGSTPRVLKCRSIGTPPSRRPRGGGKRTLEISTPRGVSLPRAPCESTILISIGLQMELEKRKARWESNTPSTSTTDALHTITFQKRLHSMFSDHRNVKLLIECVIQYSLHPKLLEHFNKSLCPKLDEHQCIPQFTELFLKI
jgi:hypothetical protein